MKRRNSKHQIAYGSLLVIFTLLLVLPSFNAAYALFLSKARIDIQKNQNYAEFLILNRSEKKKLITFSWSDIIVKPDGGFKTLKEGEVFPGFRSASPYIRYSPRRTILNPGESQRVKMYVKRPADMSEGEYHSHFNIVAEALKPQQSISDLENKLRGSVQINAGTSIPVFVRHGDTNVDVAITEAYIQYHEGLDHLFIRSVNNSTRSTYGLVTMQCVMPSGENIERELTTMRLYSETKDLLWKVGFNEFPVRDCQRISISVRDPDDFEYNDKSFARADVEFR